MWRSPFARLPVAVLLTGAFLLACDDHDDSLFEGEPGPVLVPAAWQGEWNVTTLERLCDEPDTLSLHEDVQFLCEGETLTTRFIPLGLECEGTATDTRIDVECDFDGSEGPCRLTINVDWTMTRSGDDFTGTARVHWVSSGGCDPDTTLCVDYTLTGTRIGDGLDGCFSQP